MGIATTNKKRGEINMTKQEFDLKYRGEKVAVYCDTLEKDEAFRKQAKSFGYKYLSGNDLETYNYYENEKGCYYISEFGVRYDSIDFIPEDGRIVEYELDEPNGYVIEGTPSPMKETFKVGDVVYAKKNGVELKVTETDLYRLETKDGTAWFMKKELLTKQKPLKEITEKELADMGYVLKK